MFESAVGFSVTLFMFRLAFAENCHVLLQICLCEEDACAVWAFVVVIAVFFFQTYRLMDVYEDFFAVKL